MLKLIILSLLGKKVVSSRVLFNSIKSYLIVYMLVLPAFLHAAGSNAPASSAEVLPCAVHVEEGLQDSGKNLLPLTGDRFIEHREILLAGCNQVVLQAY